MLKVKPLDLPGVLPTDDAIKSCGQNRYSYEPEVWELDYEGYRYLGRLPVDLLASRYRGILRNMRALVSPDRHLIPSVGFLSSWYWYRKEHQTRLEFHLRGLRPPEELPVGALDNPQPNAPTRPRSPNACDVLFRYGELTWMKSLVELGSLRLVPASQYLEAEGEARADDETKKIAFLPGEYSRLTTQDGQPIPTLGDLKRIVSFPDYYVVCGSCDWDDSLFDDFSADSCVVIAQKKSFEERLERAAAEILPGWLFCGAPIEYFDPYETPRSNDLMPPLSKDFRFAYQREYRWSWTPLEGQKTRGPLSLDLGSLAGLVTLHVRR